MCTNGGRPHAQRGQARAQLGTRNWGQAPACAIGDRSRMRMGTGSAYEWGQAPCARMGTGPRVRDRGQAPARNWGQRSGTGPARTNGDRPRMRQQGQAPVGGSGGMGAFIKKPWEAAPPRTFKDLGVCLICTTRCCGLRGGEAVTVGYLVGERGINYLESGAKRDILSSAAPQSNLKHSQGGCQSFTPLLTLGRTACDSTANTNTPLTPRVVCPCLPSSVRPSPRRSS